MIQAAGRRPRAAQNSISWPAREQRLQGTLPASPHAGQGGPTKASSSHFCSQPAAHASRLFSVVSGTQSCVLASHVLTSRQTFSPLLCTRFWLTWKWRHPSVRRRAVHLDPARPGPGFAPAHEVRAKAGGQQQREQRRRQRRAAPMTRAAFTQGSCRLGKAAACRLAAKGPYNSLHAAPELLSWLLSLEHTLSAPRGSQGQKACAGYLLSQGEASAAAQQRVTGRLQLRAASAQALCSPGLSQTPAPGSLPSCGDMQSAAGRAQSLRD